MLTQQIITALENAGVTGTIDLTKPPKADMGDFAFACFGIAKEQGKNPAEVASELAEKLNENPETGNGIIAGVKAFGPYVNFFLDPVKIADVVLADVSEAFGKSEEGKGKKIMVEFGCPNPLKAMHLGHLKNLITGEAVCRVLENVGYNVIRVNYQGDVGMQIAKAMWGIMDWKNEFEQLRTASLQARVEFIGKAYAHGATAYEEDEAFKQEIIAINDHIYEHTNEQLQAIYQEARQWSLDYFETIYAKLGARFDEYYFESDVFTRGVEIVREYQRKGVFRESEGAIIFPGSEHGLHDRVFINSKGFPTYEAKELALAEMRAKKHPDVPVIHVVGKEQTEYFNVVFAAMRAMGWNQGKVDQHLPGGFLQLKGEQKMSSRKGNVITGDELLNMVRIQVEEIMNKSDVAKDHGEKSDEVLDIITDAALTYSMLKADIRKDIAFDLKESISTQGDSGPYLLYIVARINSILGKAEREKGNGNIPEATHPTEKALLLTLAEFPDITKKAADELDPSHISRYVFGLAQQFNSFYEQCQVLSEEDNTTKQFRLSLIDSVRTVMVKGLHILGIETVEHM